MGNKDVTKIEELTENEHLNKIKAAIKEQYGSSRRPLIDSIALGVALIRARKALTTRFYTVIDNSIIHRRQNLRFQKLVIDLDSYEHLKNNPTEDDIEKLQEDKRITSLKSQKDIEKFVAPSMKKLMVMKEFSLDEFQDVINGKDEIYVKIVLSKNENEETEKEKKKEERAEKAATKKAVKEERLQDLTQRLNKECGETITETLLTYDNEKLLEHIVSNAQLINTKEAEKNKLMDKNRDLELEKNNLEGKNRDMKETIIKMQKEIEKGTENAPLYTPDSMKKPVESAQQLSSLKI